MENVGFILSILLAALLFYLVVLVLLFLPVAWKWRERASWRRGEIVMGLLPLLVWLGLLLIDSGNKSMANLGVEPLYLGIVVSVLGWMRVSLAPYVRPERLSIVLTVAGACVAWLLWWKVPGLPE